MGVGISVGVGGGVGIGVGVGVIAYSAVGTALPPPGLRTRGAGGRGGLDAPRAVSGNPKSSLKLGVVASLIIAQV